MRQLAELDETDRAVALERFRLLRPHLEVGSTLAPLAEAAGVTLRTAQRWVRRYRADGLAGLARRGRADLGSRHSASQELVQVVEGLALQRPPLSMSAIHREVARWARGDARPAPSHDTVRRIIRSMPPGLLTLGREGEKAYRDAYDLVLRREAGRPNEMWQADHTPLDLVARRDNGREGRPWLTLITDDYSRAIAGFAVSFDAPSAIQTALALRQAIWRKAEARWSICGIPESLYSDNGSDFTSAHIQQVAADLKIRLVHSTPGIPRGRGKVERLFRSINQKFLCHLPGYRHGGSQRAGAPLALAELDQHFREFIAEYHGERHSETRHAPMARWTAGGFLPQMAESLEQLDLLLVTVARSRIVRSDGLHFAAHRYIDSTLSAYVGETVMLRYDPRDIAEVRVFHNGRYLCRAIAPEVAGEVVALKDVVGARNRQRRALRQQLHERQAVVTQLLELRQGREMQTLTVPDSVASASNPRTKIRHYRTERP
jgi:putative transposase